MTLLLIKLLAFGLIGLHIECFFTGIISFIYGDRSATCKTYLWMMPVYGTAAVTLESVHGLLGWNPVLAALLYVPIIYAFEFVWGWLFRKILGKCPWDYGKKRWSVMGLIRLDFAPFWFLLALCINPALPYLEKFFLTLNKFWM